MKQIRKLKVPYLYKVIFMTTKQANLQVRKQNVSSIMSSLVVYPPLPSNKYDKCGDCPSTWTSNWQKRQLSDYQVHHAFLCGAIVHLKLSPRVCPGRITHMATHRYACDAQWPQAKLLTPVEDDQTLQHQTSTHHKQVRHIVEAWPPAIRTMELLSANSQKGTTVTSLSPTKRIKRLKTTSTIK